MNILEDLKFRQNACFLVSVHLLRKMLIITDFR